MGKVLILQNAPLFTGGSFEAELQRRGITYEYHKVFEQGAPSLEQVAGLSGLIVLGGPLKFRVEDAERHPVLSKEVSFLRACLEKHLPILAVSQGALLLAQAQGAWVAKASQKEIDWVTAEIYPDYSRNSVIYSKFEEKKFPALVWYDTVHGFPPTGYWYVHSPHCRYLSSGIHGNCYLFQFHPEATPDLVKSWVREYGKELASPEAGERLVQLTQEHFASSQGLARKIVHAFESFLKK